MCVNLITPEGKKIPMTDDLSVPMYQVLCTFCGPMPLTYMEYYMQISQPDSRWFCPSCRAVAAWDDDSGVDNE